MRNRILYIAITSFLLVFYSCDKEYLEKIPQDEVSRDVFFNTDNDFRAYSLGFYTWYGYGVGNNWNLPINSDDVVGGNQLRSDRIFDNRVIPDNEEGWNWEQLRAINIMIEAAKNADLDPEIKNHWEGVARFYRANFYYNKVGQFGDVPWIDHELGTESPELYAKQDSRATVMGHVLEDLNFAVANIREDDGENFVDKEVALALKSRVCLFEGTFRKYHTELNLSDGDTWLNECVSAAGALMNGGGGLSPDYRDIYSSLDLAGNPEVYLYKQYEAGEIENTQTRVIGLMDRFGVTKDAVESFLCSDGLPYGISDLHPKAQVGTPELPGEEFEDRDPRMGKTMVIPYDEGVTPPNDPAMVITTSDVLPIYSPSFWGEVGLTSPTGYGVYKWWNPDGPYDGINGILDAPLLTFSRILLEYAEAKAVLGTISDADLDKSINLLRARVGMPDLTVAIANSIDDPKKTMYAPEISNILWEVRRERRVELMLDGSRLGDIIRWKKASYFSKPFVGAYVDLDNRPPSAYKEDGSNKTTVTLIDRDGNLLPSDARTGYAKPYILNQPTWADDDIKLYYTPIDNKSLTVNPNLEQSPGW